MICKCEVVLSVSFVIVSSLILLVTSFNVDTFNYVQHKGPEQSMFGFSVATHKEHGRSWVLVGAPTSQGERSRIHRGGVVFKCSTTSDNGCDEIDFHQEKSGSTLADDKNNQWFGATVSSAGPDGPVVACAPRYVWFTTSREERRDPVGTCYIARDDFRKFSEYSPCRTSLYGYHRQGSCQAGFSAGISKDGRRLFVGAPGSWYWQGQMYSIDPMIKFPDTPGMFGEAFGFGAKGQVIQQSLDDRPAVMSTPEGPATDDDSYMGYSMIVGDFNGAGVQGIAVGMPKGGEMLEGKVLLYTWNLTNYLNITGYQLGSYFGYALAAVDVDGDRRDDIIIGAPMHVEPNNELKYEVGRVHIAYQGKNGAYETRVFLDGFKSKSRFGLSLSSLGDMNLDGYGDFAVGAPYDGPSGHGAVYIFQGSANGVIKQYSQVIYAEDVQGSLVGGYHPLSTFGFSIAGGLDLDGNDYPDVAIGAYLSDTAYFFRARPVVRVEAIVRFDDPKVIQLDRKTCDKPGDPRIKVPCTWIQVCMRYTGVGAPPRIDLNLQYLLDVQKPSYSRMYSSRGNGKEVNGTITLYKDAPMNCDRSLRDTIYIRESIADKLTDLEIQVKYNLRDSGYNYQQYQRDPRAILLPIIDLSTPAVINDTISIFKNCGPDNVCIPDLHLFVRKEVTKYLYDADKPIEFDVEITNSNDDSYNTKFFVELPQDIEFRGAPVIDKTQSDIKLACSPTFNRSIFSCDVGNPLMKNTGIHFKLRVAPKRGQALLMPTYVFRMNVTSANPENNFTMYDNTITISIDIWVDAILAIEGKSTPTTVYYNVSQYNTVDASMWDTELGPPVIHSYTVTNKGPSDVNEVEIYIIWPGATLAGEELLYLVEPPNIMGDLMCEKVDTNVREKALSLQGSVWDVAGIHKGQNESHGISGGTGVETASPVPPMGSNTIIRTVTTLIFYDINHRPVHVMELIGEQGSAEYWKNVSIAASQFIGPIRVEGNSSSLVIKYANGREVSRTIEPRKPVPAELPYLSYLINSNVSTIVSYYGLSGNLVAEETIIEQPGSVAFKDRIKSTQDRLRQPVRTLTNTTWHFDYVTSDDRIRYHYILHQTGTDSGTNAEIASTVILTYISFYDSNGKVLHQEVFEGDSNSAAYWERVNKIIAGFHEPVSIRIKTTKVTTYVLHGKEIRKDEIPVATPPQQAALTTNTKTITTVKVTNFSGKVLVEVNIPGEKGSTIYNQYFNSILTGIKEPVLIETKTVYTITYSSSDGREIYRGIHTEIRTETHNPNVIESTRASTITTITFYDINKNIVYQENITEAVGSVAYWERVNELMSRYHGQQITINIHTKSIITHYVNNEEVSSEQVDQGPSGAQQIIYRPQTVITTTIRVFSSTGQVLEETTVPGRKDSATDIFNKYNEPITVEIKIVTTITYYSADGQITHRGTYTETRTETHSPRPVENSQTRIITTVIVYDLNRNIIYQENITDAVGSESYWERLNGILSRHQQHQATVRVITKTVTVYYIDGAEVRSVEGQGPSRGQDISYRTQVDINTRIVVYDSNRRILYDETTPGRGKSINDILSRFNDVITVEIHTIHTITYYNSDSQVVYIGTFTETRTESHRPNLPHTNRKNIITTVIIYDVNRNIIYQEEITEEPQSAAYWDKINKLIARFQQQYQQITIHVTTRTVITYYVDGHATHTEEVTETPGAHESSYTPRVAVTTVITVYNANRKVLFEQTISSEKGSTEYNNYINSIKNKFREPITVVTKTTYIITYYGSSGQAVYTGREITEDTETYSQQQKPESRSRTITVIKFYGPNGNLLREETLSDEPKSTRYWEYIKEAISSFEVPVNIYTNSSRAVTYYVHGVETQTEYLPGTVMEPFTSHFDDAETMIMYLDAYKNVIHRETIQGELTAEEKRRRATEFSQRHGGSFTMEIETTKTVSFRTFDGHVLYSGTIEGQTPLVPPSGGASTSVTETTLTVYGPDRRTILYTETISGEPGSAGYNKAVADIIGRFTGSITIYTNSTKTITYYGTDGRTVNQQILPEPRSTVQRQSDSNYGSSATTTITFYGPDGTAIHHDTIDGAPGADLYRQLDEIAREYGGVVKSYGGVVNEDGSIGGPVTVVDTPYPGGKPKAPDHHFTDFEAPHRQTNAQWNARFNQTEGRGGYGHSSDTSGHRINYQDLNTNQQDLGAFAKGKGFRTGGIDLGVNSGNVDQSVDGQARSHFESYSGSQSYDGNHNYLSGGQTYQHEGSTSRTYHGKRKREVDTTDRDIDQLSQCTTSKCFTIRCTSGPLRKGHEVHIALRARVVVQTLKNISMTQPVNIQSMLLARISKFQEISGSPAQRILYRQQAITSVIAPSPDIKPDIVPLWVVILSAVAGTLILLLLIFLLHKCGFFKRNRPSNAPERQPLNRNGHFQHGDEAL